MSWCTELTTTRDSKPLWRNRARDVSTQTRLNLQSTTTVIIIIYILARCLPVVKHIDVVLLYNYMCVCVCINFCSGAEEGTAWRDKVKPCQEETGETGGTAQVKQSRPEHGEDEINVGHRTHIHCLARHVQYHVSGCHGNRYWRDIKPVQRSHDLYLLSLQF